MSGYKFRVLLDSDKKEEIFRDIWIAEDATFEAFYNTIIQSFGFSGQELASFYESNEDWDKGHEISSMDMGMMDEGDGNNIGPSYMGTTFLNEFTDEPEKKYILVYDFMRMWIFLVELIDKTDESPSEPEVVMVVGEAPAEDTKDFTDGQFETERMDSSDDEEDEYGFGGFSDGLDSNEFDNIDDYDI